MTIAAPTAASDLDLYSDAVLADPHPVYRTLREIGPVVYLPTHDLWALPRYAEVRQVLEDWETFTSSEGVGLVPEYNSYLDGTMLSSDPPDHDVLRAVLAERVSPRALRKLRGDIGKRAERLVADVVSREEIDVVNDLAKAFPVSVVADLIGLPEEGRDRLLIWADATFNSFGPENERAVRSVPVLGEIFEYVETTATKEGLAPGSMGRAVYEAADRGEIRQDQVLPLMLAYLMPAMDTTVNAIGSAVWLFAQNPDQWEILHKNPDRIPKAFEEVMRIESPLLSFSRVARPNAVVADTEIPEGSRVVLMFASANRDERRWEDPDRFDVMRDASEHLAFGYGVHGCPGQGLARIEAQEIFASFARRGVRFELNGEPERHLNNVIRGFAHLPVRLLSD